MSKFHAVIDKSACGYVIERTFEAESFTEAVEFLRCLVWVHGVRLIKSYYKLEVIS